MVQADHGVEVNSESPHPAEGGASSDAESVALETGKGGRPITEPCGTLAAYRRHKRKGEVPCAECRTAYNAAHRRYYAKRLGLTPRKRDE